MEPLSSKIGGEEFPVVKRGYDPSVVDEYLTAVAAAVRALEEELSVTKAKAAQLLARLQSSRDADTVVQTAFLAAAEAKSKLLQEAEARGAQIIEAAEARAAQITGAPNGSSAPSDEDARMIEDARARVEAIEQDAIRRLEEAKTEAEAIIAEARHVALDAVDESRNAVLGQADEAREELHRLMWLLKTVKQAVHTGLVAAEEEAPELELILNDGADMAALRPDAPGATR